MVKLQKNCGIKSLALEKSLVFDGAAIKNQIFFPRNYKEIKRKVVKFNIFSRTINISANLEYKFSALRTQYLRLFM